MFRGHVGVEDIYQNRTEQNMTCLFKHGSQLYGYKHAWIIK